MKTKEDFENKLSDIVKKMKGEGVENPEGILGISIVSLLSSGLEILIDIRDILEGMRKPKKEI